MKKAVIILFSAFAIGGGGYFLGLENGKNKTYLSSGSSDAASPQEGKLLRSVDANGTVRPLLNSKTWGKTSFDDISLQLNYQADVRPDSLTVGRNTPNGTRFLARFPGVAVNLPLEFGKNFEGFNRWDEMNQGYYVQVAEHDFDGDDVPEIVVAVGDGMLDMALNVVKYYAPQSPDNAERRENWELIGSFWGQEKAYIRQDTIIVPVGSQGHFNEYTLVKGKFVETH
jgi:hypothetical protein